MALNEDLTIYGFGSAFSGAKRARDVDIAIIHSSPTAIPLALRCKRALVGRVPNLDVTVLSVSEEAHFQFLRTSDAKMLGRLNSVSFHSDVSKIAEKLCRVQATHK